MPHARSWHDIEKRKKRRDAGTLCLEAEPLVPDRSSLSAHPARQHTTRYKTN